MEWGIVAVIAVAVIFGVNKLPDIARNFGRAQGEFKKGLKEGAVDDMFGVSEKVVEDWMRERGSAAHAGPGTAVVRPGAGCPIGRRRAGSRRRPDSWRRRPRLSRPAWRLEPLLRAGGIWRDVPAAGVSAVFRAIVHRSAGATPPSANCSRQRLRANGRRDHRAGRRRLRPAASRAPASRLGRDSGTMALLAAARHAAAGRDRSRTMCRSRACFSSWRRRPARISICSGRLSRLLARGPLRETGLTEGAADDGDFPRDCGGRRAGGGHGQGGGGDNVTPGLLCCSSAARPRGGHRARAAVAADVAGAHAGRRGGGSGGGACRCCWGAADWEWRSALYRGRRSAAPPAGWRERVVSRAALRGRRSRGGVCARVLAGPASSRLPRRAVARWWSATAAEHGPGAAVLERTAFSHRLGAVHRLRVLSDHAGSATTRGARGGLAVSGRLARGHGLPVRVFRAAGGAHRELGSRPDARTGGAGAVVLACAGRLRREGGRVSRCTSGCPRRTPTRRATSRPSCPAWRSRWAFTASCASAAGCRCRRRRAGW